MNEGLSNAEVALMAGNRNGFGDGNGNGLLWFFALLLLGFGNGFGGGNASQQTTNLYEGLATQTMQGQLGDLGLQIANGNYATAQAINDQTNAMLQQNNTNLINAIQGFNAVNQALTNQTNQLSGQISALGAQLSSCCCEIKTQMLQDKYERTQSELDNARNQANLAQQSQYMLGQMGRWVAWTPEGSAAAGT